MRDDVNKYFTELPQQLTWLMIVGTSENVLYFWLYSLRTHQDRWRMKAFCSSSQHSWRSNVEDWWPSGWRQPHCLFICQSLNNIPVRRTSQQFSLNKRKKVRLKGVLVRLKEGECGGLTTLSLTITLLLKSKWELYFETKTHIKH